MHPRERTDSWLCVFGLVDYQESIRLTSELVGWLTDEDWWLRTPAASLLCSLCVCWVLLVGAVTRCPLWVLHAVWVWLCFACILIDACWSGRTIDSTSSARRSWWCDLLVSSGVSQWCRIHQYLQCETHYRILFATQFWVDIRADLGRISLSPKAHPPHSITYKAVLSALIPKELGRTRE